MDTSSKNGLLAGVMARSICSLPSSGRRNTLTAPPDGAATDVPRRSVRLEGVMKGQLDSLRSGADGSRIRFNRSASLIGSKGPVQSAG